MEDWIKQIAEKLGVDEDQAGQVLGKLQEGGHDVGGLLQGGNFLENAKGLLGDDAQNMLSGIPGLGGMLGGLLGSGEPPSNETGSDQG